MNQTTLQTPRTSSKLLQSLAKTQSIAYQTIEAINVDSVLKEAALMYQEGQKDLIPPYLKERIQKLALGFSEKRLPLQVDPRLFYFLYDLEQMDFHQEAFERMHRSFIQFTQISPPEYRDEETVNRELDALHLEHRTVVMPERIHNLSASEFDSEIRKTMLRNKMQPIYLDFRQTKVIDKYSCGVLKQVMENLPINHQRIVLRNINEPLLHFMKIFHVFDKVTLEPLKRQ
ncbi:MAG: hypothetical protein WA056_02130 [Gallionella sp.]